MMPSRYGVPHGMSKNRIAAELVSFLPAADNFCDLFAGGGAITHAALESRKYKRVFCNDIDEKSVGFFVDAISGKFNTGQRVIDRETFEREKGTDPYVRFIWSFGCKGDSYLWGRPVERVKLAACRLILTPSEETRAAFQHELKVITGGELTDEEMGFITEPAGWNARRLRYLDIMRLEFPRRQVPRRFRELESLERLQALESLRALEKIQYLGRIHSLERLEPLERISDLATLDRPGGFNGPADLIVSARDYRDVEIPSNSVIYCDIPYKGSVVNDDMNMSGFDFPAFYGWACKQENIFISSYDLPGDLFEVVWEKSRRSIMSSSDNKTTVVERLYIPRRGVSAETARPVSSLPVKDREAGAQELYLFEREDENDKKI